ncbi:MAG: hypothetical protein ABI432_03190 [Flavobacteriales bacterium]
MAEADHNAILKRIARGRLLPLGIVQQGRSRTFLLEKGWYTIVIEFQPSSFSKGTYLNVGADFHFFPRDHFAFAHGYREKGFEEFENEEQFAHVVHAACDRAIERVRAIEQELGTYRAAIRAVRRDAGHDPWRRYELGFLRALNGDALRAKWLLRKVTREKPEHDFEFARQRLAQEIIDRLHAPTLAGFLAETISTARRAKGLRDT